MSCLAEEGKLEMDFPISGAVDFQIDRGSTTIGVDCGFVINASGGYGCFHGFFGAEFCPCRNVILIQFLRLFGVVAKCGFQTASRVGLTTVRVPALSFESVF